MKVLPLLLSALVLVGCSQTAPPATPVTAAPASAAVAPSVTKESLNDQAFAKLKAENWNEAIRLAQQAVALDANYAPARFNLGLALYHTRRYAEAQPQFEAAYQLNKTQAEPGWYLYRTLDALGQNAKAAAVLADLQARFPDDPDVKQAAGGGALVWSRAPGERVLLFLGDREVLARPGARLELRSYPDKVDWTLQLDADVTGLVPDQTGARALAIMQGAAALIDLTGGKSLGPAPSEVAAALQDKYNVTWRGDLIYIGSGSNWRIYRLVSKGQQVTWQEEGVPFASGQQLSVSTDGHLALGQAVPGAPFILFTDGKERRTYDHASGLSVAGDAIYTFGSQNEVTVTDLDGKPLAAWQAPAGMTRTLAWDRPNDTWYVAAAPVGSGGYIAVDSRGARLFGGDGELVRTFPNDLLVRQGAILQLVDAAGKSRLSFPGTSADLTPDGRWVYTTSQSEFRAFRLP